MVTKVYDEPADTSNGQSRRSQQHQLQCTLKMDAAGSSEIMVRIYQTTKRHVYADGIYTLFDTELRLKSLKGSRHYKFFPEILD